MTTTNKAGFIKTRSNILKLAVVACIAFGIVSCQKDISGKFTYVIKYLTTAISGKSKYISMVKNGRLEACPKYTVDEMVESFMGNPTWEHILGTDSKDYVNIRGQISYDGQPATGVLQFWVKDNHFGVQSFVVNDQPQNMLMPMILISKMCESAAEAGGGGTAKAAPQQEQASQSPSFTDSRDGKTYKIVTIGGKTWMAANLNYRTSAGSWCYGDDEANCDKYGRLYDWNTAKKSCPVGWHLPSSKEWDNLMQAVGGKLIVSDESGDVYWEGAVGTKLKSTAGWNSNGNGTDNYGFSALPGGYRDNDGSFDGAGSDGYWWTVTESNSRYGYNRYMNSGFEDVGVEGNYNTYGDKSSGFSVRCLRD